MCWISGQGLVQHGYNAQRYHDQCNALWWRTNVRHISPSVSREFNFSWIVEFYWRNFGRGSADFLSIWQLVVSPEVHSPELTALDMDTAVSLILGLQRQATCVEIVRKITMGAVKIKNVLWDCERMLQNRKWVPSTRVLWASICKEKRA